MSNQSPFNPETFTSGGFLDDVDVTVRLARVVTGADTPFDSDDARESTFLQIGFQPEGHDADDLNSQYYKLGKTEKFSPSSDGKKMVGEGRLNKNSKAAMFFNALVNAGFNVADFPKDGDVTFLEGLKGHVINVPMPEIKGKDSEKFKRKDGQPSTVLVFKSLSGRAGDKKTTGAAKTATKTAAKTDTAQETAAEGGAQAASNIGDVDALIEAAVLEEITGSAEAKAQKRLLPTAMLKAFKTDVPTRTAAFKLVGNDGWLGDAARPWQYDVKTGELSLG